MNLKNALSSLCCTISSLMFLRDFVELQDFGIFLTFAIVDFDFHGFQLLATWDMVVSN